MGISPHFEMSGDEAKGLLYGLLESNKIQLRKYPNMPSVRQLIQDGKIEYKQADPEEHWQTYKELTDQVASGGIGYGDCEDLATAIAAEDQVRYGVNSLPYAYSPRKGLFHVVTAVPSSGKYGQIPVGDWPDARGARPKSGYTFQDPSAAAGMGSFGALPSQGASMDQFGAADRRKKRGIFKSVGEALAAFRKGAIGEETLANVAFEAGAGARGGSGVEAGSGWAKNLGGKIPGALGFPSPSSEADGPQDGPGPGPSDDNEDEDDEDDEDFGLLYGFDDAVEDGAEEAMGGLIGASAFNNIGEPSGFTRDALFSDDDSDDDDIYDDDDDDDEDDEEDEAPTSSFGSRRKIRFPSPRSHSHRRHSGHSRGGRAKRRARQISEPIASFGSGDFLSRESLFGNSESIEDEAEAAVYGMLSRGDLFDDGDD